MKRSLYSLVVAAAALSTPIFVQAAPGDVVPDEFIVQLKPGAKIDEVAAKHGVAKKHSYSGAINGFAGKVGKGKEKDLAADPDVLSVVPDRVVSANAKPGGGTTTPPPQVVPEGVKRIGAAPDSLTYTGAGVGVAIVDTGLDLNHADLAISSLSYVADGIGTSAQDQNGHGTHVGGIVAAKSNTIDTVGVAPAAKLYAVRVLNSQGSGTDASIIAGLNWVFNNKDADSTAPIKVVNMSLGRPGDAGDNPTLRAAVQALYSAGVTVVVAAGNDCDLEVSQQVPASYPEVISVASTTAKTGTNPYLSQFNYIVAKDTASYFTTDGSAVDISAPGEEAENIGKRGTSFYVQGVGILSTKLGGGTTRMSGTSMASPHVAGVAALLAQKSDSFQPEDIRTRIKSGADNLSAPFDSAVGCYDYDGVREGILHAGKSLALP